MFRLKHIIIGFIFLLLFSGRASAKVNEYAYPEMYLQYVPAVFMLGAGELGVEAKHSFNHRLVNTATTYFASTAIVYPIKWMVKEERPDGSAYNSFPSAHTAAAFAGAELIRLEYGWGWGSVFYASAAYVGAMRVVHKRHHWWDVLAGAALGIGSAHIGLLTTDALSVFFSSNSFTVTFKF